MRLLLLSLLALAALACAAWADIRIAVIAPLSGPYQPLGEQIRDGAQKAVSDLNARGGIDGQRVVLDVDDDRCKAEDAAAAANRAAGRGDVLVVGHVCAAAATAAAPVYAASGMILITPAVGADALTQRRAGPTIFRLAPADRDQGPAAGAYLAHHFAKSRIAVLDDGSPYGKPIADGAASALAEAGVRVARRDNFEASAKSYEGLAGRLMDDSIDVVFVAGYPGDIALLLDALRTAGSKIVVMGPDSIGTGAFLDIAGDAADGSLFTFPTDWRAIPDAAPMVAAFRAAGVEPVGFVLPAYAAVQAWASARADAGNDTAVAGRLQDGSFATVLGDVSFSPDGDARITGFSVYKWQRGNVVPAD